MYAKTHVDGINKGDLLLFALSTCVWCKKMKRFLDKLGVAYDYVNVDALSKADEALADKEVERWNPKGTYPTLIINNKNCVTSNQEEEIKKRLNL